MLMQPIEALVEAKLVEEGPMSARELCDAWGLRIGVIYRALAHLKDEDSVEIVGQRWRIKETETEEKQAPE